MVNLNTVEETGSRQVPAQQADVLIGIPSAVSGELLRVRTRQAVADLKALHSSIQVAVAYPGDGAGDGHSGAIEDVTEDRGAGNHEVSTRLIEYQLPHFSASAAPWLGLATAYRSIAHVATRAGATSVVVLSSDLAAMDGRSIQALMEPVLDRRADLAMPLYAPVKFEGLLNSSILYPFSRALYGRRVRYPLGPDFAVSTALLGKMATRHGRPGEIEEEQAVVWPTAEAVITNSTVAQVYLDGRHAAQNEGLDLNTVLSLLAGSLFSGAEQHAAVWQRVRGSQPGLVLGSAASVANGDRVDVAPMLDAFNLASRNLQQVWGLVLPPVTLLEIKRLGRLSAEQFRIADGLWARIIYDFALAYRLRTLSRTHLLGALTPLYLGWVASYAQEIADLDASAAEQRIERLAKAFEDEKAYFVSRWRWPDRFNP